MERSKSPSGDEGRDTRNSGREGYGNESEGIDKRSKYDFKLAAGCEKTIKESGYVLYGSNVEGAELRRAPEYRSCRHPGSAPSLLGTKRTRERGHGFFRKENKSSLEGTATSRFITSSRGSRRRRRGKSKHLRGELYKN